jgi:hypothetical protein
MRTHDYIMLVLLVYLVAMVFILSFEVAGVYEEGMRAAEDLYHQRN